MWEVLAIIAVAMGLLALQFDTVSIFYANIFPKFGVGLSIFLVLIILIGFFFPTGDVAGMKWIGYVVGIGVVLWALSSWDEWTQYGFGGWFAENFWALIIVGVIVATIVGVTKGKKPSGK